MGVRCEATRVKLLLHEVHSMLKELVLLLCGLECLSDVSHVVFWWILWLRLECVGLELHASRKVLLKVLQSYLLGIWSLEELGFS